MAVRVKKKRDGPTLARPRARTRQPDATSGYDARARTARTNGLTYSADTSDARTRARTLADRRVKSRGARSVRPQRTVGNYRHTSKRGERGERQTSIIVTIRIQDGVV